MKKVKRTIEWVQWKQFDLLKGPALKKKQTSRMSGTPKKKSMDAVKRKNVKEKTTNHRRPVGCDDEASDRVGLCECARRTRRCDWNRSDAAESERRRNRKERREILIIIIKKERPLAFFF